MKKLYVFALLLLICGSAAAAPSAAKPVDEKITLSIELMQIMNFDKTMQSMQGQMRGMMEEQFKSYAACEAAQPVLREFSGKLSDRMMDYLTDENLKVDIAAVYADVFTVEELRGVIDFYRSPIGKKLIERMPELMQKSMVITQDRMKAMMPELKALGEEYGTRIQAAAKTCAQGAEADETASEE
ncbi:DUF2059 domain-containing protein [Dokdonella immobilis]|uniref:DUF2059 domain-containing protein n=1 Tax=Dokdonella immobilis TaxID=578942 RepID=A0A1I4Y8Q7_9GAMM|nr:DUF2059 domain-containing protein [Dokdonella immobilis]SFN33959.1 hypothetical protein SAMN05216289_11566 [Dokdonella immobilis]